MARRAFDYGREPSYRAESDAFGPDMHAWKLAPDELRTFAREIATGFGIPAPVLSFVEQRGRGAAYGIRNEIRLPSCGVSLFYLVHELAHLADRTTEASHGPTWRRLYVAMVRQFIGDKEADTLAESFKRHGVPIDRVGPDRMVRKAKNAPRRRFVFRFRPILSTTETRDPRPGFENVTNVAHVWGEWRDATAEEIATLSPVEKRELRRGFILWKHKEGRHAIGQFSETAFRVFKVPALPLKSAAGSADI